MEQHAAGQHRGSVDRQLVEHRVLRGRQFHQFPGRRHPAPGVADAQPSDAVGPDGSLPVSWSAASNMLSGVIMVEGKPDIPRSGNWVPYRNVENTNPDGAPAWRDAHVVHTRGTSLTIPAESLSQTGNNWKPNSRYVARVRAWNLGMWKVVGSRGNGVTNGQRNGP